MGRILDPAETRFEAQCPLCPRRERGGRLSDGDGEGRGWVSRELHGERGYGEEMWEEKKKKNKNKKKEKEAIVRVVIVATPYLWLLERCLYSMILSSLVGLSKFLADLQMAVLH